MSDPDQASLPWVLRQGTLRFQRFGVDAQGRTELVFRSTARGSPLRELHIHMVSTVTVDWVYGYTIVDPATKAMTTYRGRFGDPSLDTEAEQP